LGGQAQDDLFQALYYVQMIRLLFIFVNAILSTRKGHLKKNNLWCLPQP